MARFTILALAPFLAVAQNPGGAARFETHTIASDLRGGYQVVAADLNHDGKPDLIALGQGMSELVWFENPTWERHVLATGVSQMVNCVVLDGGAEIVLASGFSQRARDSKGIVSVLRPDGDARRPWTATEIDRLPTTHRLRLARIDAGPRVVVSAPLTGADAEPPDYKGNTPLVYYRPGEWKRRTISDENTGIAHGLLIFDWDGDGRDEILTASFTGIHLFRLENDGRWTRTQLAAGDPAPWPKSGSSDVAVGSLAGQRFLAAIEPWHGNQVSIYRLLDGKWARQTIEDKLTDGHALLTADLNGNHRDEVLAGFRGQGGSVYLYTAADAAGERWTRETLDGSMNAAACAAADLDGDGRIDLACIDGTRLKWYENRGPAAGAAASRRAPQ
jgi:hypothetical protein